LNFNGVVVDDTDDVIFTGSSKIRSVIRETDFDLIIGLSNNVDFLFGFFLLLVLLLTSIFMSAVSSLIFESKKKKIVKFVKFFFYKKKND
jgi:hypothetical protein